MTGLVYLLLAAFLGGICLWFWHLRSHCREGARAALVASLVGLLMIISSALLQGLSAWGLGNAVSHEIQRMSGLAAQHMSLPLLALASLYLARGLQWKPAVWAQIILALMACYELSRYLQWQPGYQWLINIAALTVLSVSGWLYRSRDKRIPALCAVAWAGVLIPAFLSNSQALASLLDSSHQASWLIPGITAIGLTVGLLAEQAHNGVGHTLDNQQNTAPRP